VAGASRLRGFAKALSAAAYCCASPFRPCAIASSCLQCHSTVAALCCRCVTAISAGHQALDDASCSPALAHRHFMVSKRDADTLAGGILCYLRFRRGACARSLGVSNVGPKLSVQTSPDLTTRSRSKKAGLRMVPFLAASLSPS